ncbi:Nicotinate-nucleotide pyrophosphorylase [carboxylating] [Pirellulimonas nuda]|uniref:Probable nicotinate-nucleotide pyrophosphorylase [carboxylating] n=1 Tax=Pirellulimonas nuda TaxID=2528009 RepID=A0A518D8S6_9BACT|nr:carboxylating nicotinate-nucleotide diphosphorylase [Pirellulimonas nuda]QDU87854.1 Nicotinate-nucleotide pyrophosphorylase [carboxylating] [Pirellulimonas nuda]
MSADFSPIRWDATLEADCRKLIRLALDEDLAGERDWTTWAIVGDDRSATADIVARAPGIVAGLQAPPLVFAEFGAKVEWDSTLQDGAAIEPGQKVATMAGNAGDLLTTERTVLNFLGRLCGIATLTARFVAAAGSARARVYDTRKTTPGWRRLEKYAARCGGGHNHRAGLYDAVLIKDNHLALSSQQGLKPADAVLRARQRLCERSSGGQGMVVEVEVDTLDQLREVLPAGPDIVLLDNMGADQLRQAIAVRDAVAPEVVLEASGGISLSSVAEIAATGVDRLSVGALTHSAVSLDLGLDWRY